MNFPYVYGVKSSNLTNPVIWCEINLENIAVIYGMAYIRDRWSKLNFHVQLFPFTVKWLVRSPGRYNLLSAGCDFVASKTRFTLYRQTNLCDDLQSQYRRCPMVRNDIYIITKLVRGTIIAPQGRNNAHMDQNLHLVIRNPTFWASFERIEFYEFA